MNCRSRLPRFVATILVMVAGVGPGLCGAADGLPAPVVDALEAVRFNRASDVQRALLFQHNAEINQARLNGWISDGHYQAAQGDFATLNKQFAEDAAKSVGGEFTSQRSKSTAAKPRFSPGTDSDYIIKLNSGDPVGDVIRMQERYNGNVNAWIKQKLGNNATFQPRTDWHNQLDVDFMADPKTVTNRQFDQIAKLNNDAYKRRLAADAERIMRLPPGSKETLTPAMFREYTREMQDFIDKKQKLLAELREDPGRLSDPAVKAEYHRLMAQEQKYIERIESLNGTLRKQEGLPGGQPRPHDPYYEMTMDENGNARLRKRSDASIALRGAERSPTNFGTTGAASAVAENSASRAVRELAESMAEAGQKNPAAWGSAADEIAKITAHLPPAEKGMLIERLKNMHGEGVAKSAAEGFAQKVADAMRREAGVSTATEVVGGLKGAAKSLDDALRSALGVSDDLSRMGNLRRGFNESAARALGGLENLNKIGTAATVLESSAHATVFLGNLVKAFDPNVDDDKAAEYFRKAQESFAALAKSGGLAALCEAVPTFGVMYGGWTIGYDGTQFILTSTETGESLNRSIGDYVNRHVRASESAANDLTKFFGGESDQMRKEDQASELEKKYWEALRAGRIILKPGVRTIDVAERIRAGDFIGAKDLVEPVDPSAPDATLATLERELQTLNKLAARVKADADQVSAEMIRALAQIALAQGAQGKLPAVRAMLARAAAACEKLEALKTDMAADADGAVKAERLVRQSLDEIDERARRVATADDQTRVLAAYDKVRELVGKVRASARHARQLRTDAATIVDAARDAKQQLADAQAAIAGIRNYASAAELAAARGAHAAEQARGAATELSLRHHVLRGQVARMRSAFQAAPAIEAKFAALEVRVLAVPLTATAPLEGNVATAGDAATKVKAVLEGATAELAAATGAGLCDSSSVGDEHVRNAENAANDAADRLAQSDTLRDRVIAWKPESTSDLEKARGTLTRKPAPREEPDLNKARGSLTKTAPPAPPKAKTAPETKSVRSDLAKTPPQEKKPIEDPDPTPGTPPVKTAGADEKPKELQPFYVVFDLHLPMPPAVKDPLSVPMDRWAATKLTRVAFRVSGRALEDFAAEAAKNRPAAADKPLAEEDLFETGGFYFQDVSVVQPNAKLPLILLYKCAGISKTAEGLRQFGAFQQPPPTLQGNQGLPNLHVEMSGSEGRFTIANLAGNRLEGETLRKDSAAAGSWSRPVQVRAASALNPLLKAIGAVGEAVGDAIPTIK
jgi:hypothetical protein